MKQDGKFTLFDPSEFSDWLSAQTVNRRIVLIQNHHTYIPAYKDFHDDNHFTLLHGMEAAHLKRGFNQIAQNLTTFPDGTVAICRPFDIAPAGILGANTHGICIENVGDFDSGQDDMTDAHKATILKVNALLCRKFGLTPGTDSIVFHHWFNLATGAEDETGEQDDTHGPHKSCPGTAFFGGNTMDSAQNNFVPLVQQELNALA